MDKRIDRGSCNGIICNDKKEWTVDIHNNMNKPRKHQTQLKEPGKKEFVLFDPIFL